MIVSEKERGLGVGFCRIRRITGYLTGNLSTWGSSKLAEERDRVKHVSAEKDTKKANVQTVTILASAVAV